MANRESAPFSSMLLQHRAAAGLTQEQLAARAGVSPDTIAALEHGRRRAPRGSTVELLASALELDGDARAEFVVAARTPAQATLEIREARNDEGAAVSRTSLATLATLAAAAPTQLVDRADELAIIRQLLIVEGARLLTLTGPAGVGKTRLALAAATQLEEFYRDGIVFVDLTPIRNPGMVFNRLAASMGLLDMGRRPLVDRLLEALGERRQLLILDNFEQVVLAAAQLGDLLVACPELSLLVTSRVPLQLRWERTLRLAPLPVPNLTMPSPPLDELLAVPSVELFVQRARRHQADFAVSKKHGPLVARLTAQLDGLPLALELAAARVATLSLPALATLLDDRLRLLRWEAPDVPERHQSLEAAVGWSYDLLRMDERCLFRCLGVFVGHVSLDAVAAVAHAITAMDDGDEVQDKGGDTGNVLEGLLSLAQQSLILPVQPADMGWGRERSGADDLEDDVEEAEPAFGVLETVRAYAEEQLEAEGELAAARRAHAHYFLVLAERADSRLRGRDQRMWYLQLERELDNLRAALRWLLDQNDDAEREAALRLVGAMGFFWMMRGYHAEGFGWLEEALNKAPQANPAMRVRPLIHAGLLLLHQRSLERARMTLEEALALAEQRVDRAATAEALTYLGGCALHAGEMDESAQLLSEALRCGRELGDPLAIADTLFWLAARSLQAGSLTEAATLEEEALELYTTAEDMRAAGAAHSGLAVIRGQLGDLARAVEHARAGLRVALTLSDRWLLRIATRAALTLSGGRADPARQAQLLGAIEGRLARPDSGGPGAYERWSADQGMSRLREQLGQGDWDAAQRAGRVLRLEEVATLAVALMDEVAQFLSQDSATLPTATKPPAQRMDTAVEGRGPLTAREREVLRLVAAGLSSKAIGQQLSLSPSTINQHVKAIFNKLGVDTRAQAVAVATQQNLL